MVMGWMTVFVLIWSVGLSSLDSCVELPKMRNSVLDGFRERRLADIQVETPEMDDWRRLIEEE